MVTDQVYNNEKKPLLTIKEILKYLPHKYPFVMVDRVESLEGPAYPVRVGRKIHSRKNVTYNEPYFPGHFPHRAVMPGVMQIEAMGQTAALLGYFEPDGPKDVAIVGLNNCKFRHPVFPGDTLDILIEIVKERAGLLFFDCKVQVEGKIVSQADLLAKLFLIEKGG